MKISRRARRETAPEMMERVGRSELCTEQDISDFKDLFGDGPESDNYVPIGRDQRLAGDGIEPEVFSDGRGNGGWESHCWYCGCADLCDMVQEHMRSRARHGSDDASNIVAACHDCNAEKRDLTVEGFRARMETSGKFLPFVFAGEANLRVEDGSRFAYILTLSKEQRIAIDETSIARKNPEPPPSVIRMASLL